MLTTLRSAGDSEKAQNCAEYIQGNRHRVRYATFSAADLRVGSDVLESGCKTAKRQSPEAPDRPESCQYPCPGDTRPLKSSARFHGNAI